MQRKHALLSASGAHRWLICTPSARLEETMEEVQSNYADEGTLAHQLAEWLIREKAFGIDISNKLATIQQSEYYNEEMHGYCDEYADYVVSIARAMPPGTVLSQEQKLYLTDYIPEGFGTTDVCLVGGQELRIIDLKYGKGVPVDAYENEQLMTYALGALEEYDLIYNLSNIIMTVYQPRINNISHYEIKPANLRQWGYGTLREKAREAYQGVGELVAGEHCRWCCYKPVCAAYAKLNLQLAARQFDVTKLTDEQVSKILLKADSIIKWVGSVKEHAMREALAGKKWPGMKLVYGRSNRRYTDEKKILEELTANGIEGEQLVNKKLIGITEMSKKIPKLLFEKHVEPYLIKPEGKPTLTVDADARPMIDRAAEAAEEFTDYEEVEE